MLLSAALWLALAPAPSAWSAPGPSSVERTLARLTTRQQAGQLLVVAVDTGIARADESMIRGGLIGGGLLRWDRFTGRQARRFSARMREWTRGLGVGFLLAADQEGGALFTQRLYGGAPFPGNMALGAAGDPALARRAAYASGRELAALGIQADFAPDVDVNDNPDNPVIGVRSFGENPRQVAALGAAAIKGYLAAGVMPAAKHFPGHGNTSVDSHKGLPVLSEPLAAWRRTELPPFIAAVRARAPMIMTAHIVVSALDPASPATLSSAAIEGALRGGLGYGGVVVSDSLDMGAIANSYGEPEAAVRALLAGCDLLLLGKSDPRPVLDAIVAAARSGRLPRRRLLDAVRRVLRLKRRAGLLGPGRRLPPLRLVGSPAHRRLARRTAERGLTLLRDRAGKLPLRLTPRQSLALVVFRPARYHEEALRLIRELARRQRRLTALELSPWPSAAELKRAFRAAGAADTVVLGAFESGGLDDSVQVALFERLRRAGRRPIVLSLMSPYDLSRFSRAGTMLCAYGMTDSMMEAVARLLFGEIRPRGRLPVTIPGVAAAGAGLSAFRGRAAAPAA
ncbi:MAG: glycoside hydrolase family 3 C-terminal domain-containing protein, partial [Elusimicrobia bacterium]|nr:glycoside hydrolase family 3 C-terminal domain-containing protein [Elusimicrobiota bacterium]